MPAPRRIEKEKLLLAEGQDAKMFFVWAYQAFGSTSIQVEDFGGIDELGLFLKTLPQLPGYEMLKTIVIVRDAENNPDGAVQSIRTALRNNGFPVPARPFEFSNSMPRIAFMVLPGFEPGEENPAVLSKGTLEDLCLWATEDDPIQECVDLYLNCLQSKGEEIRQPHKCRLHAYLSGKNSFVGLKIGEAARAGAWDWNHPVLNPFRQIIEAM